MTLPPREVQILRLRAKGLTHLEVAYQLGLAESTVRNYTDRAFRALDVHSATAAFAALGWLHVTEEDPMPVAAPSHDDDTFYGYLDPDPLRPDEDDDWDTEPRRPLRVVASLGIALVAALVLLAIGLGLRAVQ